jgi:hypothetical protein
MSYRRLPLTEQNQLFLSRMLLNQLRSERPLSALRVLHYRQLIQKFLSVAVNFSQGANDYLQADFANMLGQEGTKAYSAGAHDFDEAFGYYGASRDINDYSDDEAAGKGGRAEYGNGYYDSNGDGLVDIRSEFCLWPCPELCKARPT